MYIYRIKTKKGCISVFFRRSETLPRLAFDERKTADMCNVVIAINMKENDRE